MDIKRGAEEKVWDGGACLYMPARVRPQLPTPEPIRVIPEHRALLDVPPANQNKKGEAGGSTKGR